MAGADAIETVEKVALALQQKLNAFRSLSVSLDY